MLEQFVTVMPGTLPCALLIMSLGVMLTVGEGRDKPISAHWRLWGFLLGLVAAVVFAALRATAIINQRTFINYPVLWCAVVVDALALAIVICAHRITHDWAKHAAAMHLANAVAAVQIALTVFYALPDVILQLTIWVEPGETAFTSAMLLRALGFVLGVVMSIVVAAIFRTMRTTAVRWAFTVAVALMMAILLVQHLTGLTQIMQARGLRMNHTMFVALAWSINHNKAMIMAQAVVFVIPVIASLVAGFRIRTHNAPGAGVPAITGAAAGAVGAGTGRGADAGDASIVAHAHVAGGAYGAAPHDGDSCGDGGAHAASPEIHASVEPVMNEATLRRHKAFRRRAIAASVWSLVAMIGVTCTLTFGVAATQQTITLSPPEAYALKDGVATIPFSQVEDGHLHRFEYTAKDGTTMRFIIIKKNGGAYGIGLDACDNCGDAGYYEKDGKIICKKCEVAINLATIGFKGGCNPIPFPYKTGNGQITIQTADLDALSVHFQ